MCWKRIYHPRCASSSSEAIKKYLLSPNHGYWIICNGYTLLNPSWIWAVDNLASFDAAVFISIVRGLRQLYI